MASNFTKRFYATLRGKEEEKNVSSSPSGESRKIYEPSVTKETVASKTDSGNSGNYSSNFYKTLREKSGETEKRFTPTIPDFRGQIATSRTSTEDEEERTSTLEHIGLVAKKGLSDFNKGVSSTLALVEKPWQYLFPGAATPLGDLADYYADRNEEYTKQLEESTEGRGKVAQFATEAGAAAVAAIPNALLAFMTGGTSAAAQGTAALGTTAASSGLASTIGVAAKEMVKNPLYWTSVAQTLGNDYEEAKKNGASELEATATALISSALNAGVEIGGGLEVLPDRLRNGGSSAVYQWVKGALEEGKEEVVQGVISGITEKTVYDRDKEYFSTADDEAIVNPGRMGKEFVMGATVGGVLGGAQLGGVSAANAVTNRINNKRMGALGSDYQVAAEDVISEGLTFAPESPAYQTAQTLKAKLDAGESITDAELGWAVYENERAIQNEARLAEANADPEAALEQAAREVVMGEETSVDSEGGRRQFPNVNRYFDQTMPTARNAAKTAESDIKKLGYGEHGRATLASISETQELSTEEVNAEFHLPYLQGLSNMDVSETNFTSPLQREAFNAGKLDRIMNTKKDVEKSKFATVYGEESGLVPSAASKTYNAQTVETINKVSKAFGTKTMLEAEIWQKDGKIVPKGTEGAREADAAMRADGVLVVSLNAGDPIYTLIKHEITHRFQQLAPVEYGNYRDAVMRYVVGNDVSTGGKTSTVERYQNALGLDVNRSNDEIAADFTKKILKDEAEFSRFVDSLLDTESNTSEQIAQNRTFLQKFVDTVREFIDKVRRAFSGDKSKMDKAAQKEFGATVDQLERIESLWKEAAKKSAEVVREKSGAQTASIESQAIEFSDRDTQFSVRKKEPPKNTGIAYKVFFAKNGQLYPPMVANPGGAGTPVGVWLDADVGQTAAPSKTGRPQVQAGGKGTNAAKGSLAFRPGWHLGDIPLAKQFARKNPATGEKDLFPADFVWAECEYAMDHDYQEEAMSYGYTENGKFRHSYAGLPRLPEDGYYRYRTNPNPDTVPWVITGAMKVNRILTDAEVEKILRDAGVEPMKRQGGEIDLEKLGLKAGDQTAQFSMKKEEDKKSANAATRSNDERGTMNYSTKEDGNFGEKGRKEDQQQFLERSNRGARTVGKVGRIVYAYRAVAGSETSYTAEKAAEYLNELGIPSFYHDGLEVNQNGETTTSRGGASAVGADIVGIYKSAYGDAKEIAGHEAFHVWIKHPARKEYMSVLRANLQVASDDTMRIVEEVQASYFESDITDRALFVEEFFAKVSGMLHSGEHESELRNMFGDYDAVASAWQTLTGKMVAGSKAQFSMKDSEGATLTKEQQEFFKDSKERDRDGNLRVMYNGGGGDFTVFDRKKSKYSNLYGRGFYFTNSESHAKQYGDARSFYLNIVNPVSTDERTITKKQLRKFLEAVAENEDDYSFENYGYGATVDSVFNSIYGGKSDFAMLYDVSQTAIGDMVAAVELFNEANGTTYDGLILDTETVIFNSEQAKLTSNENPTSDPDIQFSMKKPRESGKNLIAMHNLSAEKLEGALELGGFPMPSIAIVKNDMGHDKFGDISVLFRKETISPTDRRNKVYGGDAWTPTMPSLGYKVSDKVRERIETKVEKLLGGRELMNEFSLMLDDSNVDDNMSRWNGDFKRAYSRNEALKIAFLKDKGIPFKPVMKEKQYSHTADNVVLRRIDRALGGKSLEIANSSGTEEAMKHEPLIRKLLNDWYEEQGAPRVYDKPLGYAKIDQLLRAADKYTREGAKKEIDTSATRTRLENKFTKKLTAEYEAWLDELSAGIIEKRGIRNDRDWYTPSGNRRSFEQLYMDYNLQNIVKAMAGEEAQKGGGLFGTGNIHGAATKDYTSIAEIKADSARLMQEDEETHEAAKSAFNDRFADITARMVKPGDDGFGATLDAGDAAVESLLKGKSVNGILRELKSWRRFNATQEIAQDIYDLARDISEAPTAYFEAKPRRAVGFDEVAAVVMPRSTSADLKARLEGFGVQVLTYNPKKDGDRLKKINSVDDISFSMKGQSSLLDENKKLREVNEALREQFKTTKFAQVDKKQLDAFAKKLLQDYESGADINETRDALNDLYVYMANGEDGQAPVWSEVQRRAYDAAVAILEEASTINDDLYQEYKSLRNRLRKYPISINKMYDGDLGGYESINEFRKANFGRIKLTNDGTPVDIVYNDLASTYPEFFDEYHYSTQADQLVHIAEVLDSLQPYEVNPYSYNMREAASWLADDIIERFYELPQAKPTFADKAEQKLTKQVIKDAKKLETLREQKNERIAKLIERSREKVRKTQQKERTKRAEAVAKVRDHYEAKEMRASDRRKASIWRKKIKKHVDTISKLLLKGNDNSHVPEEMREVVSEFLSVIDLTTPRQKEKTINRLNELRTLYKKIADNETEIETEVDPDLAGYIDDVTAALKQGGETVSVEDLNNRELEALYRVLLAVERSIYTHNRAMAEGKTAQISEIAQKVMIENSTGKAYQEHNRLVQWGADMVNMDMLNPQDYFIQLGDTMNDMFGSIRNGFDKKIRLLAEAKSYMEDLLKDVDVKTLSDKKAVAQEFKTGNGQIISLTPAQVMSLYLLQRQKDALDHIYKGGIKPAPVVAREGKDKRAKVKRSYDVVKVTPDDVAKILKSMTPEQQKIADGISKFFTDYTAKWGNEVSLALYGYKKFTVENYFPIVSDQNYLKDVFGETTDATLKNMGSTKARIQGASNPIIIEDALDVFARQADQMSSYNAFVIPLSDIQRVFNFKTKNGSVKQSIEKRYGVRATQYFKKLMTDINGGGRWNGGSQLMNEMVSRYKQAKMGLNLRVVLQQPSAMLRAQAVIDGKYLAQAMAAKSSVDLETIYKYAPVAQWKNWGFFSMDTGKQMKDVILDTKQLSDYTMWAAGKMDEITWKRLWVASELEVRDKQPDLARGSEEYLEAVGKRFSEIIDRTQVVDSVLHRSQIMRNPDALVKMSVAFMNEPFKAYNMVRTAATQFKHNPTQATKQALWAAGVAYMSTLIVNNLITAAVDTWRGDEEDEEWLEKIFNKVFGKDEEEEEPKTLLERYLWHFADNAVNEPLSMFPFVKDVVSMVQGYDVKRMDMQGVGDFVNALTRGLSDKYTIAQKVIDIGSKFGDLLGIPVSSLKRELSSVVKLGIGAAGSPLLEYEADKVLYTVTGNKSRFMDILYKAYKAGDMEAYRKIAQDMIDEGITPSYIESGIKSRAKKDGVSVNDMSVATFSAGVEAKYEVEKPVEDKFDINKLSGNQYTQFIEDRGQMLDEIISDFQRHGFGSLDEETANELLTAAYTFAEETALEDASGGLYESDTKWIDKAQNADELGLTVPEYLMLRSEYSSDIGADGVYDAYDAGVDVETYLEFKDALGDLEYAKGVSGARKEAIVNLLNSMGLTQDEWDYLFGTEYKTGSAGFGGSFGGGFGGGFGGSFGGKFGK